MNILVLCTGNSARSILLEAALGQALNGHGHRVFSAGSRPAGRVHPEALALLSREGLPTAGLRSKSWDEFAAVPGTDRPPIDLVLTTCASAAGEACPLWPGQPLRAHWGADDPAAAPAADQPRAFAAVWRIMQARAAALAAVLAEGEVATMDRATLFTAISGIGEDS